jgi:hypothetical protein
LLAQPLPVDSPISLVVSGISGRGIKTGGLSLAGLRRALAAGLPDALTDHHDVVRREHEQDQPVHEQRRDERDGQREIATSAAGAHASASPVGVSDRRRQ